MYIMTEVKDIVSIRVTEYVAGERKKERKQGFAILYNKIHLIK
jgi:hypothetical protein